MYTYSSRQKVKIPISGYIDSLIGCGVLSQWPLAE
jgi:hypothetical protein